MHKAYCRTEIRCNGRALCDITAHLALTGCGSRIGLAVTRARNVEPQMFYAKSNAHEKADFSTPNRASMDKLATHTVQWKKTPGFWLISPPNHDGTTQMMVPIVIAHRDEQNGVSFV